MKHENYSTNGFFDIRKVNFCYINENLNEMLYNSYNISSAEYKLKDEFNTIKSISYVKFIDDKDFKFVDWKEIDKGTGFFKIDLLDLSQLDIICKRIENTYGWFPYSIRLNNHIIFRNWNQDGNFIIGLNSSRGIKEYDLFNYIHNVLKNNINSIELFVEAKYTFRELLLDDKDIYHLTKYEYLKKIQKNGLIPKTKSGTPNRIYFGKDPDRILRMFDGFNESPVLLKLNMDEYGDEIRKNIKFYKDPRVMESAFFTYSNIPPKYLQVVSGDYHSKENRVVRNLKDLDL